MAVKFSVIAEVVVKDDVVRSYDGLDFEFKDALSTFISNTLKEKGYGTYIKVYEHDLFGRLSDNAEDYILRDAQEEIENEILNSKMCVGGNCED
jgi:hypothetical protein